MPTAMAISCLKIRLPMVKQHFVIRSEMSSINARLVKYLHPQHFDVQYIDVFENPMRHRFFDLKTKFITSDKTLIRK